MKESFEKSFLDPDPDSLHLQNITGSVLGEESSWVNLQNQSVFLSNTDKKEGNANKNEERYNYEKYNWKANIMYSSYSYLKCQRK